MPVNKNFALLGMLGCMLFVTACGSKHMVRVPVSPSVVYAEDSARPKSLLPSPTQRTERRAEGMASWYGPAYHGKNTANGEVYNMNSLTAAHPSLPFDSKVRVTNKSNQKQVVVRINDRGPFVEDRIIDLSKEAARRLGMIQAGVAPVRLEPASSHGTWADRGTGRYTIQLGFFSDRRNAVLFYGKLKQRCPEISVEPVKQGGYRIVWGDWKSRAEAERGMAQLQSKNVPGFVRAVD
jgi:rare lipoprotein A